MAFNLSQEKEKVVDELIARYPTRMAACIPVLHLCQEEKGWVSPDIIEYVAGRLGMTTSQVKGVVTFYTMYHQHEVAPHVIWVCRTLSCELRGAKIIQDHLEKRLGCKAGGTSRDGKVTLLTAECLASCGTAPMIQLDDEFRENLTVDEIDAILDELGVAYERGPAANDAAANDASNDAKKAKAAARPASTPPPAAEQVAEGAGE